jgi:hypothetical protein
LGTSTTSAVCFADGSSAHAREPKNRPRAGGCH